MLYSVAAIAVIAIMLTFFTHKSNPQLELTEYRQEIRGDSTYVESAIEKLCDVCNYQEYTNRDCYFINIYWDDAVKYFDMPILNGTFTLNPGENLIKMSNRQGNCWVTQLE